MDTNEDSEDNGKMRWCDALVEWESGGITGIPIENLLEFMEEIKRELDNRGVPHV